MIGCECPVCTSTDPRNRRRRASLFLEAAGQYILIDTAPDFREQALAYKLLRVDAVIFTHAHADHILGFDDIRRYNTMQDAVIPAYGSESTIKDVVRIFDYIKQEKVPGLFRPRIDFRIIDGPFDIGEVHVEPVAVVHGVKPTNGYIFREGGSSLAYVPDCLEMDDATVALLKGVDLMILDGLKRTPHVSHLTIDASVELLKRIGAKQSYIVHMSHDIEHKDVDASLPDGISLSYDGLEVEV